MRTHLRTTLLLLAVLVLGLPAAARANSADVIRDCAYDGKLDKTYTQKELQKAYNNLPSDANEYTDCASVIRAAMTGGSGNTGPGPANGIITASGAVAGSQNDVQALTNLIAKGTKGKRPAVTVAGEKVQPGNAGLSGVLAGLAASNSMPTSLMLAIAGLALLALVAAYLRAREKFPHVRRVALRLFGR
jgi:hypothetical protein